jgi:hypothetical protein
MVKGFLTDDGGVGAYPGRSGGPRGGGGRRGASPTAGGSALRSGVGWGGVASVDSEDFAHFGSESEVGREFDIEDGTRITNLIPRAAKQAEFWNPFQFRTIQESQTGLMLLNLN